MSCLYDIQHIGYDFTPKLNILTWNDNCKSMFRCLESICFFGDPFASLFCSFPQSVKIYLRFLVKSQMYSQSQSSFSQHSRWKPMLQSIFCHSVGEPQSLYTLYITSWPMFSPSRPRVSLSSKAGKLIQTWTLSNQIPLACGFRRTGIVHELYGLLFLTFFVSSELDLFGVAGFTEPKLH